MKGGRIGFDQEEDATLVEAEDPIPLGDQTDILPKWGGGPGALPCPQIDTSESLVAEVKIGISVNDDRGRHITRSVVAPALGDLELLPSPGDVVAPTLVLVAAGKDRITKDDRRQDVHSPERGDRCLPEYLPIPQIDSRQDFAGLDDELALAGNRRHDRGGERPFRHHAILPLEGTPEDLPGSLVDLDRRIGGLHIEVVAVDQGGADQAKVRHRGSVSGDKVDSPALLASGAVKRDDDIPHPGHIERLPVEGWGRTDPISPGLGIERHRDRSRPGGGPSLGPSSSVEGADDLRLFLFGLRHKDKILRDDRSRVARLERRLPDLGQMRFSERSRPDRSRNPPIPGRPSPLCPGRQFLFLARLRAGLPARLAGRLLGSSCWTRLLRLGTGEPTPRQESHQENRTSHPLGCPESHSARCRLIQIACRFHFS